MVGFEKSLPMSEQRDDNKKVIKSSDEAVEDIEQLLLSLLEAGADYEKNVLSGQQVLKFVNLWFKYLYMFSLVFERSLPEFTRVLEH